MSEHFPAQEAAAAAKKNSLHQNVLCTERGLN